VIVAPEQKETSKRISRTAFHETAGRENRVSATMRIRISVETRLISIRWVKITRRSWSKVDRFVKKLSERRVPAKVSESKGE
tara:strand:- start:162 stop:407 length:246 start_codon:yes stop_codon:yes gene_type:complete